MFNVSPLNDRQRCESEVEVQWRSPVKFNVNLHHFLRNVLESFVMSLLRRACMVVDDLSFVVLFSLVEARRAEDRNHPKNR